MSTLITIDQLAAQFQVSAKSIYNDRSSGDGSKFPPAIKVGGQLRWRQIDVDAWEEAQLPQSNVTAISRARAS